MNDLPEDERGSRETVIEHFEFNVIGAWVGDSTPAFLEDGDD